MNIFDNILDNYLYLYYTETYPRYDSLQGCSISFETHVFQGWEWIFCQRDSWRSFTSKDCLDWMFTSRFMYQNLVNEAINATQIYSIAWSHSAICFGKYYLFIPLRHNKLFYNPDRVFWALNTYMKCKRNFPTQSFSLRRWESRGFCWETFQLWKIWNNM